MLTQSRSVPGGPGHQDHAYSAPMRLAAIVLSLALLLAACDGKSHPAPGSSLPTVPTPASTDPLDAAYLDVMHGYLPGATDRQLLAIGHGICREFADGLTWTQIVGAFVRGGTDAKTSGATVAVAVLAFCPSRRSALPHG
jgi:hypothetical protein